MIYVRIKKKINLLFLGFVSCYKKVSKLWPQPFSFNKCVTLYYPFVSCCILHCQSPLNDRDVSLVFFPHTYVLHFCKCNIWLYLRRYVIQYEKVLYYVANIKLINTFVSAKHYKQSYKFIDFPTVGCFIIPEFDVNVQHNDFCDDFI